MPIAALTSRDVATAGRILIAGGLVGLPTETVYGLAADAENVAAVRRIFAVKGRPADHPLIVHIRGEADLAAWAAAVPGYARRLASELWPGPLTLVLPRSSLAGNHVTGGQPTVGLRAPSHPVARSVLDAFAGLGGRGLAAPSANRFGRVSPTTAEHVVTELGEQLSPGRDLVLDGGTSAVGIESTILDCTGPAPVVLRPGAISAADVLRAGGVAPVQRASSVRAPGTLAAHYAPQAQVLLTDADALARSAADGEPADRTGVLAPAGVPTPPGTVRLSAPPDADGYAQVLYAALREADALGLYRVLAVPPAPDGIGEAVLDRLRRAAASGDSGKNL